MILSLEMNCLEDISQAGVVEVKWLDYHLEEGLESIVLSSLESIYILYINDREYQY